MTTVFSRKPELWDKVQQHLADASAILRTKSRAELEVLIDHPQQDARQVDEVSFEFNTFAEKLPDGRLAVVVDAWRYRFLGWSQSTTEGFAIEQDGTVSSLKDEDYWKLGY